MNDVVQTLVTDDPDERCELTVSQKRPQISDLNEEANGSEVQPVLCSTTKMGNLDEPCHSYAEIPE